MTDLPVNIDTTYADDGGDPTVALHQQHHDALHAFYNAWLAGTVGGGAAPPIMALSGKYRSAPTNAVGMSAASLTANRMYLAPFYVPAAGTLTGIGVNVTTAHASGVSRVGAYSIDDGMNPANGVTLLSDFGTISVTTTGTKIATGSVAVAAGWTLLAVSAGASAFATDGTYGEQNSGSEYQRTQGYADVTSSQRGLQGWARSGNVDAALPGTATVTEVETNFDWMPYIYGRVTYT